MRRVNLVTCATVLVAIGAGLLVSCAVQPEPSEEAVLCYLRAAQVDGKVRRAWPAGQAYVDDVLEIDAQLKTEIAELERYRAPEELWLYEDPRWRDEDALTKRAEELRELLEGHRPAREALLRELGAAIEKIPSPLAANVEADAFANQMWGTLAPQGQALGKPVRAVIVELEECVGVHLELCRTVMNCVEFLDPHSRGLAMADESCRVNVEQQHAELAGALEARREAYVRESEARLTEIRSKLAAPDARADKYEHQYLMDLRKYLRDGLQSLPKDLYETARQKRRELASIQEKILKADEDSKADLIAEATCLELRVRRLEADRARFKPRVDDILASDVLGGAE